MSPEPSARHDKQDQERISPGETGTGPISEPAATADRQDQRRAAQSSVSADVRSERATRREKRDQQRTGLAEAGTGSGSDAASSPAPQDRPRADAGRVSTSVRTEPTTKRERRIAAREDRKRRAANAQKTARVRTLIAVVVALVVIVALILILVTSGVFSSLMTPSIGQTVPIEAADHVPEGTQITWKNRPPSSGQHYPVWSQNYGVLEQGLAPGYWVHNLEHGAVAILYNCPDGCPDVVQQLKDLYPNLPKGRNSRGGQPRVIIVPYTDMDYKIAAVAWGWLLPLDSVDADKITRFVDARIDRGPECVNMACP